MKKIRKEGNLEVIFAVPVVRCKECKWAEDTGLTYTDRTDYPSKPEVSE